MVMIEKTRQLQALKKTVRKYPLDELLSLLSCFHWGGNKFAEYVERNIKALELKKALWIYTPSLARYAIENSNDYWGQSNRHINEALNDLMRCVTIINELKDSKINAESNNPEAEISKFQFQIAQQQFGIQETPLFRRNELMRSILIYKNLPLELSSEISVNIPDAIEKIYGLNVMRFFDVLLLFMIGYRGGWFKPAFVDKMQNNKWGIKISEIQQTMNKLTLSYVEFRDNARKYGFTGISNQFYGYTPFDSYPVVAGRQSDFLILSPFYFLKRIYLGIYYDLLGYYQTSYNLGANDFSNDFGKIFEQYTWKQFGELNDGAIKIREFTYSHSKKFTDINLKYNDALIMIECKKNRLRIDGRFVIDENKLKEDLGKAIVKGLKQIHARIKDIKNRDSGLEQFYEIKKFYPIVCTFDDAYLLNDLYVRSMVDNQLSELGISFEIPWQIIKISEVEELIPSLSTDISFLQFLRAKLENLVSLRHDWQQFRREKNIEARENPILEKIGREILEK